MSDESVSDESVSDESVSDESVSDQPVSDQVVSVGKTKGFTLPRTIEVTIVPAGTPRVLAEGERVTILQALGNTATVTTSDGEMARLNKADSIDFGFIEASDTPIESSGEPFSTDQVWEAATTVYDPEIPVDIVELGLVYRVDANELDSGGWHVEVDMSVTAPFCGMGDILRLDLHDAVEAIPGVETVDVKLVFDPPWDASRLSDVARLELGFM